MWSTLWILLIAPFVACNFQYSNIKFNPALLHVVQERKDIESYCMDKYESNLEYGFFTHESCISLCRYTDENLNIQAVGGAKCEANGEISHINNDEECYLLQEKFDLCIPECSNHPGACYSERISGWKPNPTTQSDGAITLWLSLGKYNYNEGDFTPPHWREIMEYRYELCEKAYKDRENMYPQMNSCLSFCRFADDKDKYSFGGKCDFGEAVVPIKKENFCSEYQNKLQKCIPECENCPYEKGIPGFKHESLPQKIRFPVPQKQIPAQTYKLSKKTNNQGIKNEDKRRKLCDEIYSNPAAKDATCLSFCLYQDESSEIYKFKEANCMVDDGMGCYDRKKPTEAEMCNYIGSKLGENVHECKVDCEAPATPSPLVVIPTRELSSTVASTTISEPTTENTKTTAPLISSSKTQAIPSTTAKVALTTAKMPDIPRPIGPLPTYEPEPTDEVETVDPNSNQKVTKPAPSATGEKKEEGGGSNLKLLWILLPVALLALIVGGGFAGFLVHRRRKARKSKGKSKTVEVEMGTLPPPPSMPKRPSTRRRPYLKITQVDETAPPPREMPSGQITDKKFKFEGKLDLDATGTHGKTTHQLDGAKSHSLRDVMFSDQMNRVFDMGSQVENVIPSPPREGVAEGHGVQQQAQEGGGQQGEQGGQGGQSAPAQGAPAPAAN